MNCTLLKWVIYVVWELYLSIAIVKKKIKVSKEKHLFLYVEYFILFFLFYFIFKLYNIVLVLSNIEMNPPQVYLCSPSWTPLPPHTLPLGHPSAPAPSIQYHASNLDWQLVSYMILYMLQCHSPKSSPKLKYNWFKMLC